MLEEQHAKVGARQYGAHRQGCSNARASYSPKSLAGKERVEALAVIDVFLAVQEHPVKSKIEPMIDSKRSALIVAHIAMLQGVPPTHQLSLHKTFLAEATRHGSAYIGLLRILRVCSVEEAMTMKLGDANARKFHQSADSQSRPSFQSAPAPLHCQPGGFEFARTHMWNTLATLRGPLFQPA